MNQKQVFGTLVSLYSGAGGLDIGFRKAGFTPLWANDIDKYAVQTYKTIFPDHVSTVGDILAQKLPKTKNLDLVIGGPPCQGFSVAGKMDPKDPRSRHVWNFLGVVEKLKPRAFVMENVKALAVNSRWNQLISALENEAKKLGYNTRLFILNAADFGVPQSRERMFLIGVKGDIAKLPDPIEQKKVSIKEAIGVLPKISEPGNDSVCTAKITPARKPILRSTAFSGMLFNGQGRPLDLNTQSLTLPASMGGNRTPIIDQNQLDFGAEPWVIQYHQHLIKGGKPYKSVPNFLRRITVEEAAVIQSFPTGMEFSGTLTARYRQIGNAVPPKLAYHVALSLRKYFEKQ